MQLIDIKHPFYRPIGARVAIVAATGLWAAVEFYAGQPFWMTITAALFAYTLWVLLLNYKAPEETAVPVADAPEETADGATATDTMAAPETAADAQQPTGKN